MANYSFKRFPLRLTV